MLLQQLCASCRDGVLRETSHGARALTGPGVRRFSSGEAPEQTASKAAAPAAEKAAPATALGDDEIQRFLEELSALTKVR